MRISTLYAQQLSINAMMNQQAKLSKTQLQLSTGERILTPSDDPAGSVRALDLAETLETTKQYQSNIQTARNRLEFEDSVLDNSETIFTRARELTVQSMNGTLTASDRAAIGQEMLQLRDQMVGLSNTKNSNGEYIFGGYKSSTQPFVFDNALVPPGYAYQGDANQRQLRVGSQYALTDGDPGSSVFGASGASAMDTLNALVNALNGSSFTVAQGAVQGTADLTTGKTYGSPVSFNLAVDAGTATAVTLPAGAYSSSANLVTALNAAIGSTALNGKVTAQDVSGHIQFVSATSGSNSSVVISRSSDAGTFLADAGFANPQGGTPLTATLNANLTKLDADLQRVLDTRASVGARMNAMDVQENVNSAFLVDAQSNLSEVRDLDYAEAISRFNLQQASLQAAQQSYAKVQGLTLFNYL